MYRIAVIIGLEKDKLGRKLNFGAITVHEVSSYLDVINAKDPKTMNDKWIPELTTQFQNISFDRLSSLIINKFLDLPVNSNADITISIGNKKDTLIRHYLPRAKFIQHQNSGDLASFILDECKRVKLV
jgi:hypothetical protein